MQTAKCQYCIDFSWSYGWPQKR